MRAKENSGDPALVDPAMLEASPGTTAALKSIGWPCWAWGWLEGALGTREPLPWLYHPRHEKRAGKN